MTTIPSIETATGVPSAPCGGEASAPQTAWTPFPAALDAHMPSSAAAGERTACAAPAARPLAEVAAFPAALEAIAAAPLAPSEASGSARMLPAPVEAAADADAGRAVSMKSPQGVSSASAQSPQEGAAVSSKPPSPVGVPPSASGLPVPVEMVADADAGWAVSMKPPQGIPSASAQSPQEGAAVSSKPPSPVDVPPSASGLSALAEAAGADDGRAVSMKPPQGVPSASAQSPQEGAAVSSKPPAPVGVPPSASGLPVPVEMVADADAGWAVSMKPPQGVPSASEQRPQEGAAVSSKPPDSVGVPLSASDLSAPAAVSPKEADETALADAVAASGAASAPPPPTVGAEASSAPAVSAVEVVEAAFAPARAAEPAQVFVEAARAVADTLLVTPGLLRGQGEIRVQLRPDVLDGMEIRVAVEGRQLTVAFTPPTAEMAALIEQCRPQLAEQLAARVHAFQIAVDVRRRARSGEKG